MTHGVTSSGRIDRGERALGRLRFVRALAAMNLKSSFALRGAFWIQAAVAWPEERPPARDRLEGLSELAARLAACA